MKFLKKSFAIFLLLFFVNMLLCNNSYANLDDFDQKTGICKTTGTKYDQWGYDIYGYDKFGFTPRGFDKNGIHKLTRTKFSDRGYDVDGYSERDGSFWPEFGFFVDEQNFFNWKGFNTKGFNTMGVNKITGTFYDKYGYNIEGFDKNGIHKTTGTDLSPAGFDINGWHRLKACYISHFHKYNPKWFP